MSQVTQICMIWNPVSGKRRRDFVDDVCAHLRAGGAETTVLVSHQTGIATDLARSAAIGGDADIIVAAGGDGTVREVATGIWESGRCEDGVALGLLPIGTANSLARTIGMAPGISAEDAARLMLDGRTRALRPGLLEWEDAQSRPRRELFLESCGGGLDARAVEGITPDMKRRLGPGAYVWTALKQFIKGPDERLKVTTGGNTTDAAWVVVAKTNYYGGWFRLGIDIPAGGRELALLTVPAQGRAVYLRYLAGLLKGSVVTAKGIQYCTTASAIRLDAVDQPSPVHADGDIVCHTPVCIHATEQVLRIIAPAAM